MPHPAATLAPHSGALPALPTLAIVDVLADAMRAERRWLDELLAIMRRQRAAVAADDLQGLDDSVFATHRVLRTLAEARRRRREATRMLGEDEDLGIHQLDAALGDRMSPVLRVVRDELQLAAQALAGEVETNKRVLRDAMSQGERYVRALVTSGAPAGAPAPEGALTYGAERTTPPAAGEGLLINRTA